VERSTLQGKVSSVELYGSSHTRSNWGRREPPIPRSVEGFLSMNVTRRLFVWIRYERVGQVVRFGRGVGGV